MNVLLIEDQDDIRDKLSFLIQNKYQANVTEVANVPDAVTVIRFGETPIDLVIYDYQRSPIKMFRKFREDCPRVPVVLCLTGASTQGESTKFKDAVTRIVDRSNLVGELESTIDSLVSAGEILSHKDAQEGNEEEFCKIKTHLLLSVCPLKADIYIRLSQTKYVKLFKQGDEFETADLEKYTYRKGVEFLYLRNEDTGEFIAKYQADLDDLLNSEVVTMDDAARSAASVYETVQELGNRLGFTEEVQGLARTQVAIAVRAIGQSPRLAEILQKLKETPGEYIPAHSTLCAYLACAIASQMSWGSESTFFKLNLAAFLHDITLDNHKLAACSTIEETHLQYFTPDEIEAYKNHPMKAAEIAQNFKEVPPDVDTIILQHHERPDRTGFPRKIGGAYISPLSAIFIVAHDLTQFVMESRDEGELSLLEFVYLMKEKYQAGPFRRVISAVEEYLA